MNKATDGKQDLTESYAWGTNTKEQLEAILAKYIISNDVHHQGSQDRNNLIAAIQSLIDEQTRLAKISELKDILQPIKCQRPECISKHTNLRKAYVDSRLAALERST